MKKWLRSYLPIVAAAYALTLFVNTSSAPLQTNLKNLVFDEYQRWRPRPYAFDQPVRILDIDDESIRRIGQWPWPRGRIAVMVDELAKANVAAVGAGILLSFTIGLVFGRLSGASIVPYRTQSVMQGQTLEAGRGSRVCGRRRCDG